MGQRHQPILMIGSAIAALAWGSTANAQSQAPAATQAGANASATSVQDIVVTANKREERLNNVGLSVTAFSGQVLADRKITTLSDIASAIPGLSFSQSVNNTPILTLRGVGFNESSLGVYPAVSLYIDQASLPFPVLGSHTAFDLQRVEVLKGPQGTLFGQNSTGGAINFIAMPPQSTFSTGGDISYGNYNQVAGNAYITGPISDNLKARLAVTGLNADGWQRSVTRPDDRNGKQSFIAARLLLDWAPTSNLRFALNVNGWRDTSQPLAPQFIGLNPQKPATVHSEELTTPFTAGDAQNADWTVGVEPINHRIYTPFSRREFIQTALRTDFDITDHITLTSLSSYDQMWQRSAIEGDGTALLIGNQFTDDGGLRSLVQELRLSNGSDSNLRWVVGANYENSRTAEHTDLRYGDSSNNSPANFNISYGHVDHYQRITNYAFFGNAEYDITPKLTLKAGARYTNSDIKANICFSDGGDGTEAQLFNFLGSIFGTVPFNPVGLHDCLALNSQGVPGYPYISTLHQDNVSWRAGLDYRIGDHALIYFNASRGYKAGSYPVLVTALQSAFDPVVQESLTAYEMGSKLGLLDGKLQFNASAFYYDYRNKQIRGKVLDPLFGPLDKLVNVPRSRVYGAEAEVTLVPVRGLTISANGVYLNSKVLRYTGPSVLGPTENFAGDAIPFTPKWNYSANVDYRVHADDGGTPFFGVGVEGRAASDTVLGGSTLVLPNTATTRLLPGLVYPFKTNAYANVSARVGYEGPDGRWKVTVWAKNAFNKYSWSNVNVVQDVVVRYANPPAMYGVTFGFKLN